MTLKFNRGQSCESPWFLQHQIYLSTRTQRLNWNMIKHSISAKKGSTNTTSEKFLIVFLGPHSKFMTDSSFVRNRNLQERREANVIKLLYQPITTQKTNAPKSIFDSLASPLSQLMSVLGFLEFILSYRFSETISCLEIFLILT